MENQDPVSTPTPEFSRGARSNTLGVPIAIVISAVLIAGAIIYTGNSKAPSQVVQNGTTEVTPEVKVEPITEKDHILGNPNAPIVIVEYSDYDCPFCRIFHDTMTKIMDEYGKTGKVAWVYRHFPLVQLHVNAPKISEAAYCVSELGGNDAFWKFTNALNESREIVYGTNGQVVDVEATNMTRLSEFAVAGGVDKAKFESCLASGKYTAQVKADVSEAAATGARGTPYSIIMVGDELGSINGAQPYETVKQMIDTLLSQVEGGAN